MTPCIIRTPLNCILDTSFGPNAVQTCIISPLKSGHLSNQDTFFRSQRCPLFEVPLYPLFVVTLFFFLRNFTWRCFTTSLVLWPIVMPLRVPRTSSRVRYVTGRINIARMFVCLGISYDPPPPACRSDTYQDSFKSGHPLYYIGHFSRHGQGGSLGSGDPPPPPQTKKVHEKVHQNLRSAMAVCLMLPRAYI